jgi:hypothetical protein
MAYRDRLDDARDQVARVTIDVLNPHRTRAAGAAKY